MPNGASCSFMHASMLPPQKSSPYPIRTPSSIQNSYMDLYSPSGSMTLLRAMIQFAVNSNGWSVSYGLATGITRSA